MGMEDAQDSATAYLVGNGVSGWTAASDGNLVRSQLEKLQDGG